MRNAAAALIMAGLSVHAQTHSLPRTLDAMRDRYRPLIIFTGGAVKLAEEQLTVASDHADAFRERQILIVGVQGIKNSVDNVLLSPAGDAAARRRFHIQPGEFTVILLGKDGGEKLRSHQPVTFERLTSIIDAMPMRRSESKKP